MSNDIANYHNIVLFHINLFINHVGTQDRSTVTRLQLPHIQSIYYCYARPSEWHIMTSGFALGDYCAIPQVSKIAKIPGFVR